MDISCSELRDISQEMSNVASDNVKVGNSKPVIHAKPKP